MTNPNPGLAPESRQFALIIGAMKSGTTSLFDILSQHPQINPCRHKEPDFFIKSRSQNEIDDYLSLWSWKKNDQSIALESSVAYTKYPLFTDVPLRIKESALGEYKFIYMLRHPLKRIESHVRHGLYAGWGKSLDVELDEDAIHFSSYARQIDQYLQHFPRQSIFLLPLETFKAQPDASLRKICDFLGIDSAFPFSDVDTPRNSGEFFTATAHLAKLTQNPVAQFLAKNVLPARTKQAIRRLLTRPASQPESLPGRWRLNEKEKAMILGRLADDLRRLTNEFGIDIHDCWKINPDELD